MNVTYKVYDKIRALAGSYEMYRNGIKWNVVFRNGEVVRGRIEQTDNPPE
ncbi:MAG: hypothetical protein J6W16_01270 [Methanobrevibacter sp.]|jgi:hypothetical protein|nr:hypothetical protein [Methanobrevibacter sp.]